MTRFRLRDYHPLWSGFPADSTSESFCNFSFEFKAFQTRRCSYLATPADISCETPDGLGFSLFARRYLGNHFYYLFLRLLKCFTSPGLLQRA